MLVASNINQMRRSAWSIQVSIKPAHPSLPSFLLDRPCSVSIRLARLAVAAGRARGPTSTLDLRASGSRDCR
jgi:hypothetical protein